MLHNGTGIMDEIRIRHVKTFDLNSKTVLHWIKDERKVWACRNGRKHVEFDQTPQYPAMEDTLYCEY